MLASAARAGTHALLAVGRYDDALELGRAAAVWLRPRVRRDDPAALSLLGMLYLRIAVAPAAGPLPKAPSNAVDAFDQAAQHGDEHVIKLADTALDAYVWTRDDPYSRRNLGPPHRPP